MASEGRIDWGGSHLSLSGEEEFYDVFLAHNSKDARAHEHLQEIQRVLREAKLKPWIDDLDTTKSESPAQQLIEGLKRSRCCAMLVGAEGLGDWQKGLELDNAIALQQHAGDFYVFAVLLPGAAGKERLPARLIAGDRQPTDLREKFDEEGHLTDAGILALRADVEGKTPRQVEEALERERAARPRRRRALLVYVSKGSTDQPVLHPPKHDVEHLTRALQETADPPESWEIKQVADPTKPELEDALRSFFTEGVTPEDTLLFYYSGHGQVGEKTSYLCTKTTISNALISTAVGVDFVAERLKLSPAGEKIVVLDCCNGAPIQDNDFDALGEGVAVVLASQGPTAAASPGSELSEFTRAMLEAMYDANAYGEDGLNVSDLLDAIRQRGLSPSFSGGGKTVKLAAQAPAEPPPGSTRPDFEFHVHLTQATRARLAILRQLALTLEGLLALAADKRSFPAGVVQESVEVLTLELCQLLEPEQASRLADFVHANRQAPPEAWATCAVALAEDEDLGLLADLPWEYLALGLDGPHPPIHMQRSFAAPQMKAGPGARVQKIGWFSSLGFSSSEPHPLTVAANRKLGDVVITESRLTWSLFARAPQDHDLVIFQVPIETLSPEEAAPASPDANAAVIMAVDSSEGEPALGTKVPAEKLKKKLAEWRNLSWVVIETVAENSRSRTALALRRLAHTLAQGLHRPVVAICHPRAYLTLIGDEASPVFLAALIENMRKRMGVDRAAHDARTQIVEHHLEVDALVGVPLIMLPDEQLMEATVGSAPPVGRAGFGDIGAGSQRWASGQREQH